MLIRQNMVLFVLDVDGTENLIQTRRYRMSRLIDADKLIDYFVTHPSWKPMNEVISAIKDAPTAQQWIPCDERLPEEGQKVLASGKKSVFTQIYKGYHNDVHRWLWEHDTLKIITAWMPLPEPYKEVQDD